MPPELPQPNSSAANPPRPPIDWAAVRARVEHAATALRQGEVADALHERQLLEKRAREIAQPLFAPKPAAELTGIVACEIAGQGFAFDAASVRATVFVREITPLPGLPPFVSGLVNVRSQVLPVFDLRPLLQLPVGATPESASLLIVQHDGTEFGVLVDRVLGPRELSGDAVRADVPGLNSKYVRGLAGDGVTLLDVPALFADLALTDAPQT